MTFVICVSLSISILGIRMILVDQKCIWTSGDAFANVLQSKLYRFGNLTKISLSQGENIYIARQFDLQCGWRRFLYLSKECRQIISFGGNKKQLHIMFVYSYRRVFPLYLQIEHRKALTPACVSMCRRDSAALELITSQIGHL